MAILKAVGITATREGMQPAQLELFRELMGDLRSELFQVFRHGDCVGGDSQGHDVAVSLGFKTVAHPPENPRLRAFREADEVLEPLPYLVRNQIIVDCSHVMIGCPDGPERLRSGTWSTIRYAQGRNVRTYVIMPDGSCTGGES